MQGPDDAQDETKDRVRGVLLAGFPAGAEDALAERVPGARVHAVRTLPEAMAELERQPWDLAAVDHALAGGGGVDLVRSIRAFPGGANLPILYCVPSALPTETAHLLVESLRVTRLFFHPLDLDAMSEQIRSTLSPAADTARSAPRDAAGLASAVAGIWDKFRGLTLNRVTVLEDAAVALLSGALDSELRRRAEREAHKLAGAVGTFGFAQASQVARSVELLLEGDAPLEPGDALRLSEWVNQLREQLEGPPPAQQAPAAAPAPRSTGEEVSQRPLLLIASPDRELAERVTMEAEGRGFDTEWLADARGREPERGVDALVVDLSDSGALELLQRLAGRGSGPAMVVVSERDTFADRVEAARRGARSFLRKPTPPGPVLDCVEQLLTRGEVAGCKVLVVDDDPTILMTVEMLLETRGMEMVALDDPQEFWTQLRTARPDLVVLDQDMPGLRGEDLCRVLRAEPRWRDLPVLFLTGTTDPAAVHRIFAAGANDIVQKPVVGPELLTRIASRLEQSRLRSALQESRGPAGVPSRARAVAEITRLLQIAEQQGDSVAVARLDLDRFARVNERLGESAADEVLRRIAILLQTLLRPGDVVGWWGGDEFVVGMYGADRNLAAQRLKGVMDAARGEPVLLEGEAVAITLSAGLAEYPLDGHDPGEVSRAAEGALQAAKEAGGDRLVIAGRGTEGVAAELVDVALVEDDEVLSELLLHALSTQGLTVRHIPDGARALDLLGGPEPPLRPRVILLDVDLPEVDGLSVLRELARAGAARRAHVVMLTARSTEREVLEALELGAADHVAKPFSIPILLQRVRSVLQRI